jgi:nucleotide-binding universal stress UspA family protein
MQARRLLEPDGTLTAVVVVDEAQAAQAGFAATHAAARVQAEAEDAKRRAEALLESVPGAAVQLVHGRARDTLGRLADETRADLIALGGRHSHRLAGIALGGVATHLLHDAPQSVLVARPVDDVTSFPRRVVVGVDGSPAARDAAETVTALLDRLGGACRVVVARGGKEVGDNLSSQFDGLEEDARSPVDALVEASREADLLVVGSRGVHGVAALGSVSERVAHQAHCSVLVVRVPRVVETA